MHSCAIVAGAARCWGANFFGQLGDGTTAAKDAATQVGTLTSDMTKIAAGAYHGCTAKSASGTHEVYCWGSNSAGQIGDNTSTTRLSPVLVQGSPFASPVQEVGINIGPRWTPTVVSGGSL